MIKLSAVGDIPYEVDPEEIVADVVGDEAPVADKVEVAKRLCCGALDAAKHTMTQDQFDEVCIAMNGFLKKFTEAQQAHAMAFASMMKKG